MIIFAFMKFKAGDRIEPTYRKSKKSQSPLHVSNHGVIIGVIPILRRTALQRKHSTNWRYTVLWDGTSDIGLKYMPYQTHSVRYIDNNFKQCRKQRRERSLKSI